MQYLLVNRSLREAKPGLRLLGPKQEGKRFCKLKIKSHGLSLTPHISSGRKQARNWFHTVLSIHVSKKL